jgi:hypothetical protein
MKITKKNYHTEILQVVKKACLTLCLKQSLQKPENKETKQQMYPVMRQRLETIEGPLGSISVSGDVKALWAISWASIGENRKEL